MGKVLWDFGYRKNQQKSLFYCDGMKGQSAECNFLFHSLLTIWGNGKQILRSRGLESKVRPGGEVTRRWHRFYIVWVVFLTSFAPSSLFKKQWFEPKIPAFRNDFPKWLQIIRRLHCFASGVVWTEKKRNLLEEFLNMQTSSQKKKKTKPLIRSSRSIRPPLQLKESCLY